ncbi:TlpA disulfide reductase family protein [Nitratidesulfovibrio sp. 1201_IL3209]|uniref:TlpA disulfide reductase family protein n=1 Tax=Nitratidesulfovibrio sp. 1201_IL3209 TaxID=3084053 RepID=UPI002FD97537
MTSFFSRMAVRVRPRGLLAAVCLLALAVFPARTVHAEQGAAPAAPAEQAGVVADGLAKAWPEGARFPDIPLASPSPETGWSGGPDVAMPAPVAGEQLPDRLSGLRGQVFIVNMYSWFCAPCQEEAPALRALYARISSASSGSSGNLAGRVRIVGIAAGDGWNLVQAFRQRHGLVFPLFADPDLTVHGQLGGLPVPFTWVLRREADGFRVLFTHAGALAGTPAQFLDRVLAAAGPLP